MPEPGLLILGLGNLLLRDDGVGPAAVARLLRDYEVPPNAVVADGGTLGLALLGTIAESDRVILVDAIRTDEPPGSLVRLAGDAVAPAVRERLSVHQVGVTDLLDAARLLGCYPNELVLLGIVPSSLALGLDRSPEVERQLDNLVNRVVEQALQWGYAFHSRLGDHRAA